MAQIVPFQLPDDLTFLQTDAVCICGTSTAPMDVAEAWSPPADVAALAGAVKTSANAAGTTRSELTITDDDLSRM
jgi:hypothetical protein